MPSSSSSSTGRGSPDPYLAIDAQPEPLEFARFLELRGAQPHQRRLRRAFLAFAGIRPGARVLDLGCGTGVVTRDIAARVGARGAVVGVDPSRAFVAEARRRARRAGARCRFRVADGRRLPFAARAFDAAVAVTVLLHVPRSDQVLAEMVRVTRSGGRVAVLDQDLGTLVIDLPDRALTRRIIDGHAERFYPNPWSGRGLLRRLRAAGLRRVRGRAFVVVEPTYDSYVRSLLERRVAFTRRRRVITAAEGRGWLAQAEAAAARGDFFMSLNFYAATGVVPG
ncbi:MAG TPA: methyltransferase domain-containing protein [Methylomirabilota bacterium]|jgi:SAM-dependent methyltransferase|nr:methyltransferase domain-containing protein [Methylomirabilota bacterium]